MHSKKLTGLLTTLVLLSAIVPAMLGFSTGTVSAEESGGFQYSLIDNGTAVEITSYTGVGAARSFPASCPASPSFP